MSDKSTFIPDGIIKIREICDMVMDAPPDHTVEFPVEFTFRHTIERLDQGLASIRVLAMAGLDEHEHGLGLISRTILTDFLIVAHVMRVSQDLLIEERLIPIYQSDLKKTVDHVAMLRGTKYFTEQQHDDFMNRNSHERDLLRRFYEAHPHTKQSFPATKEIARLAINTTENPAIGEMILDAYDHWVYYSKFEHIGWNSFLITRKIDRNDIEQRLRFMLRISTTQLAFCLNFLLTGERLAKAFEKLDAIKALR